jgi:hypothetical protein
MLNMNKSLRLKVKQRNIPLGRTKTIRKGIKENDRKHRAYLQGKKRGLCRTTNCVTVIVISEYWYQHAGYYYEYREPRYENRASRTTVNTNRSENTSGEGLLV